MAPRGRPPKNKTNIPNTTCESNKDTKKYKKNTDKTGVFIDEHGKEIDPPRQKRKYTRRKHLKNILSGDGTNTNGSELKEEEKSKNVQPKQRGRKRGRKSKNQEVLFKPEEVVDYIIRNYPNIGIDKIRDKLIDGLKIMKDVKNNPYLLYKFPYKGTTYYYDDNDAILNSDGILIGYFIKQHNGSKKMYMFEKKYTINFEKIIEAVESGDNTELDLMFASVNIKDDEHQIDPISNSIKPSEAEVSEEGGQKIDRELGFESGVEIKSESKKDLESDTKNIQKPTRPRGRPPKNGKNTNKNNFR
jgi:hypothetical protein